MTTTPVRAHQRWTAEEPAKRKDHTRHPGPDRLPCRLGHPDLFFAESPADIEEAKALCQGCRIRKACLAGALARREPRGVWGGQLLLGGFVAARKRPRGRPPKHPLPQPVAA